MIYIDRSRDPRKLLIAIGFVSLLLVQISDAYGLATFAFRIGGPGADDVWRSVEQSPDGGYVIAGSTDSYGAGKNDVWIIKLSEEGTIDWQRTYGGRGGDSARTIKTTSDGGFVVAGQTNSFSNGRADVWVLKFDSDGDMQWHRAYGGPGNEMAHAIEVTSDGGYLAAGYTSGFGAVLKDYFVVKINSSGGIDWAKRFGGIGDDVVRVVKQTSAGDFLVAGFTHSFGGKGDIMILKIAEDGELIWQKRYGGAKFEEPSTILEVPGGYIFLEQSASFSNTDGWMFKIDDAGNIIWQKRIGGGSFDEISAARLTPDGGFLVAAETKSFGAVIEDFWVVKFDSSGEPQWQKRYGGPGVDEPEAIALTPEGGSLVLGTTRSFGSIGMDVWFLRLDASGDVAQCASGVTSNSITNAKTTSTSSSPRTTTADDITLTTVKNKPGTILSGVESHAIPIFQCGVDVINRPPVAVNDAYQTNEDVDLVVSAPGVLDNDTDADGHALSAVLGVSTTNGDLTLNANGSFEYRPDADFYGTDSFTYRASDGSTQSNLATVTITVTERNDAPEAVDDTLSTPEDTPIDFAKSLLIGNDTDVDGDSLSLLSFDANSEEGGTIEELGVNTLRYTPPTGYDGPDTFSYNVTDGVLHDTGTININVGAVNDQPVADDDSYETNEDETLEVSTAEGILANDIDPEGESLTVSLVSGPNNGHLDLDDDGSFSYTPDQDFNGVDSFNYTANDGVESSNEAEVTITVNSIDDPPTAVADSYIANEDGVLTKDANGGVLANDSDVDGDNLGAILVDDPANGFVTLNPDGSFEYTPNPDFNGEDAFTYKANDGSDDSNVAIVTITVNAANDAPTGTGDPYDAINTEELTESAPGVLQNDLDIDGDTITAEFLTDGEGGIVALDPNGSFVYTPETDFVGDHIFTYRVFDGELYSDPITVTINVSAPVP